MLRQVTTRVLCLLFGCASTALAAAPPDPDGASWLTLESLRKLLETALAAGFLFVLLRPRTRSRPARHRGARDPASSPPW